MALGIARLSELVTQGCSTADAWCVAMAEGIGCPLVTLYEPLTKLQTEIPIELYGNQ